MSDAERNAALIRRFYDEFFNRGNLDFVDRVHGPEYRYHDVTMIGEPVDNQAYLVRNAAFSSAFPDREVDIEDLFAVDDRVCARVLMHATHTGPLGGIPPTGRTVHLASTIIYRFHQGLVEEEWEIFDKLGLYQQLGVPPPED
jgi:steroid delta-isomerase-like uncharacterized protein